jgi:hypothetical protein
MGEGCRGRDRGDPCIGEDWKLSGETPRWDMMGEEAGGGVGLRGRGYRSCPLIGRCGGEMAREGADEKCSDSSSELEKS